MKYPFPGDANLISREIVHTIPEPLRSLDPEIPEELEQLMIRALEKDPEKRLERADEFAAGLYLISQKLRGSAAAPAQLVSPEPPSEAPVNLAPPAFAPAFASAPPAPAPAPIPVVLQAPPTPPPPPAAVDPVPLPAAPPAAPVQTAQPVPVPAAGGKLRWIPYAIAAVLTFCISLSIFSRQSMRASQVKPAAAATVPAPAPVTQIQQPVAQQTSAAPAQQAPATGAPAEALPAETAAPAKPTEEQAAMIQVKALWASGKYAQALEKVDDFIASHPENLEGRIWKKKIRAAQDAEAAMK